MNDAVNKWTTVTLADACELFTDGNWVESKDQSPDGIRLIQTGNIGKGNFKDRRNKARWISPETFNRLKCQEVLPGDCLVSRLPDPVGRSCLIPETGDKMITAVDCSILRFEQSIIAPEFFNYYSQSRFYLNAVEEKCSGATRKRISRKNLGKIAIPKPSVLEQKRIVTILDEAFAGIDTAIANTKKNLVNARELFESYLNSVFSENVEGWERTTLGNAYDVRDGTHDSPKYQPEGRALVTSKNLKRNGLNSEKIKYISEEDYISISRRSGVHKGDVLFAMIGTIGNPIVVEVDPDFAIKNVALFKVSGDRSGHFLKYYLGSRFVIDKMMSEAKGTTQKFVGLGYLRQFPILLPSLDVESNIVKSLTEFENEENRLENIYEQKLNSLNELKQSLLQKAFSGELTASTNKLMDEAVAS